ncbi:hypothetical protein DL765_009712 [Monosporascus sp. GIB2]|nr:hypothetical protein DL765_009712 [Monosporascus sp. GIB2]
MTWLQTLPVGISHGLLWDINVHLPPPSQSRMDLLRKAPKGGITIGDMTFQRERSCQSIPRNLEDCDPSSSWAGAQARGSTLPRFESSTSWRGLDYDPKLAYLEKEWQWESSFTLNPYSWPAASAFHETAYDLIKWYATVGTGSYDWHDTELPFLNLHGEDAFEGFQEHGDKMNDSSQLVTMTNFKARLLLDVKGLKDHVARHPNLSYEERIQRVREGALSNVLCGRREIVERDNFQDLVHGLSSQVAKTASPRRVAQPALLAGAGPSRALRKCSANSVYPAVS